MISMSRVIVLSLEGGSSKSVAKDMLVFMVGGAFFKLNFSYAQYTTLNLSADLLYPKVWML